MAEFETRITVDADLRVLYRITVNDNGSDGGNSFDVQVGGISPSVAPEAVVAALQTFATALTEPIGYRIMSITRAVVTETPL
ncbi:hypothetical protein ABZ312_11350 [Streptomyces sp. NPDC006207]